MPSPAEHRLGNLGSGPPHEQCPPMVTDEIVRVGLSTSPLQKLQTNCETFVENMRPLHTSVVP